MGVNPCESPESRVSRVTTANRAMGEEVSSWPDDAYYSIFLNAAQGGIFKKVLDTWTIGHLDNQLSNYFVQLLVDTAALFNPKCKKYAVGHLDSWTNCWTCVQRVYNMRRSDEGMSTGRECVRGKICPKLGCAA